MGLDNRITVRIYAGDDWQDITERARFDSGNGVQLTAGNQGMSSALPEPSQCDLLVGDTDGYLWPDNAASALFGTLDQNTPLDIALTLVDEAFTATVVDGIGPVDRDAFVTTNTGSGGVVQASDFQQGSGQCTHSVPVANAYRTTHLGGLLIESCRQSIEFQLPTANVTGASIQTGLEFRKTADKTLLLRITVNTDETITARFIRILPGPIELNASAAATATITNSAQWIKVKANVECHRLQAKIYDPDDPEPFDWLIDQRSDLVMPLEPGQPGFRTMVATGNTNATPVVVAYRNWLIEHVRFYGEITQYEPEIEHAALDIALPLVANGVSRRYSQGQQPIVSSLRRSLPTAEGLVAYWPMEDEDGATRFASGLPDHPPMVPRVGTPGYAEYSGLVSSLPLPTMNGSDWIGEVPAYTDTGAIQVRFFLDLPTGGQTDFSILVRWYTDHPSCKLWQLVYRTGGDIELQGWNSESASVYVASAANFNLDGQGIHRISCDLTNSGSDVAWNILMYPPTGFSAVVTSHSGTATGFQVATCKRVWVNPNYRDNPAIGHLTVQDTVTSMHDTYDESIGYRSDTPIQRLRNLLDGRGIELTDEQGASPLNYYLLGSSRAAELTSQLELTVNTGAGVLYDGRTHTGVMYRALQALYARDPRVTLSYTAGHISKPFRPRRNDSRIRNKFTINQEGGEQNVSYELTSGRLSTLPPGQGGVGIYEGSLTVNTETYEPLPHIAAWNVNLGTADEPLYPSVTVNLARQDLRDDPTIRLKLLELRPGDVIELAAAPALYQHNSIRQMVEGYSETLTKDQHIFEIHLRPASPYDVFVVEDETRGRADSRGSTIRTALVPATTSFELDSPDDLWTTDAAQFPFDVIALGEVMSCTDINATVPQFLAAGTVSHADNASTTPGLPGGGTTTGDGMCLITCSRNAAVLADTPAGWALRTQQSNFRIFTKTHTGGGEVAPTVTYSAGSAGDVNTAVIISARNLNFNNLIASAVQANSSAQNIAFPGLSGQIADGLALVVGRKSDDWTSVATVADMTEAVDSATTVGSDQGLVVDYMTHNGSTSERPVMHVPSGQFVPTGGASATSTTLVMIFGNRQTMVVTRGVNIDAKNIPAGTDIHIYDRARWAL